MNTCKIPNQLFPDSTSIIRRYQYLKSIERPTKTQKHQIKAIEQWNNSSFIPIVGMEETKFRT